MQESGEDKLSTSDADARFLRERQGFVLGYTGEIAVSEDHFIVAQRVTQNQNDNGSLLPMVEEVERQCQQAPRRVLADSGFFSRENVEQLEERGLDGYCRTRIWHGNSTAWERRKASATVRCNTRASNACGTNCAARPGGSSTRDASSWWNR